MEHYLYVMIAQTPTKFGRAIRRCGGLRYNHASIAFDADFNEWYGFARKSYKAVLTASIVKENVARYTLNKHWNIQTIIFQVPVTEQQLLRAREIINEVMHDPEYVYNLFSVLTYPAFKGFRVYKSFTCVEFVVYLLSQIGFEPVKSICTFRPDDLIQQFHGMELFQGNMLDYLKQTEDGQEFFANISVQDVKESTINVFRMITRLPTASK